MDNNKHENLVKDLFIPLKNSFRECALNSSRGLPNEDKSASADLNLHRSKYVAQDICKYPGTTGKEDIGVNEVCLEYVMRYSLEQIKEAKGTALNHMCALHIQKKEEFHSTLEDHKRIGAEETCLKKGSG